jgi:hypothetical protein
MSYSINVYVCSMVHVKGIHYDAMFCPKVTILFPQNVYSNYSLHSIFKSAFLSLYLGMEAWFHALA